MKPVLIRADAGGRLGTGHVMRMIALAQGCLRRDSEVTIASVSCPRALVDRIEDCGIRHREIASATPGGLEDGEETIKLAEQIGARWVVVDGYHFGIDYQKLIKGTGLALMCIDDHGYSDEWHCDAILNQNLDAEIWGRYASDGPEMDTFLGSSFCLLREEFLKHGRAEASMGRVEKLLVSLGGSDPDNVTERVLTLLEAACDRALSVRVLVGADNQHQDRLEAFQSKHEVSLVRNSSDMPGQFAWADAVISAAGSTCWEWLYADIPGAVVTIADNQVPIAEALTKEHSAALNLGRGEGLGAKEWGPVLAKWLEAPGAITDQDRARQIVDGRGADRISAYLDGCLRICIATAGEGWMAEQMNEFVRTMEAGGHHVSLVTEASEIPKGDILMLLSFWGLVKPDVLARNTHNLVVHGSELPKGRGWSPVTWQILEGKNEIPLTLFEAEENVDTGAIYGQKSMLLRGDELLPEIRDLQSRVSFELCSEFVNRYPEVVQHAREQEGEPSYYKRRTGDDSELHLEQTLGEQFNLLRTVDNQSYPAFFKKNGTRYVLRIEKAN